MRIQKLLIAAPLTWVAACYGSGRGPVAPLEHAAVLVPFDSQMRSSPSAPTTLGPRERSIYVFFPSKGEEEAWVEFEVELPVKGRYRFEVVDVVAEGKLWLEDCSATPGAEDRTVAGPMDVDIGIAVSGFAVPLESAGTVSSPLRAGRHRMRLRCASDEICAHGVSFTLILDPAAPPVGPPVGPK